MISVCTWRPRSSFASPPLFDSDLHRFEAEDDDFNHILGMPIGLLLTENDGENIPALSPTPVEIVNNRYVLFDTETKTYTQSKPLSELDENFSFDLDEFFSNETSPIEGTTDRPQPNTRSPVDKNSTRKITPDMMLNITLTQTIKRKWVKIKNNPSDLLGFAKHQNENQSFDVGCVSLMQATTSGNLSGVADLETFQYAVASTDNKSKWILSESNQSFLVPFGLAQNNQYASFEPRWPYKTTLTPAQIADLEAQQLVLHNELQAVSMEYEMGCVDTLNQPSKPIYTVTAEAALPNTSVTSSTLVKALTEKLSETECKNLQDKMNTLQNRLFTNQTILDKIQTGERDYFSTDWGSLSFEKFSIDGDIHEIRFKTFPVENGNTPSTSEGATSFTGTVILKLSP